MHLTPRVAALLLLPPMLWAGNAVVGRWLAGSVPPMQLNALRWLVAALILLPLGWRVLASTAARDQWRQRRAHLLLLGGLGIGAYNALQYLALHTSTPVNVTLIAASTPAWMLLIGLVVYGERPARRQWLGAMLSMAGVLTVLLQGRLSALAELAFVPGDLWMLLAALAWAQYSWLLARPPESMRAPQRPGWDWAEFLLIQIGFGLLWAGAATGLEAAWGPPAPGPWTPWHALALLYLGLGPSVIAYRCWGIGVAAAGPATAGFFGNLTPLFATLLAGLTLGETPRVFHAVAFALIVAGIVVSSRLRV